MDGMGVDVCGFIDQYHMGNMCGQEMVVLGGSL